MLEDKQWFQVLFKKTTQQYITMIIWNAISKLKAFVKIDSKVWRTQWVTEYFSKKENHWHLGKEHLLILPVFVFVRNILYIQGSIYHFNRKRPNCLFCTFCLPSMEQFVARDAHASFHLMNKSKINYRSAKLAEIFNMLFWSFQVHYMQAWWVQAYFLFLSVFLLCPQTVFYYLLWFSGTTRQFYLKQNK